jgi:hypothetical protein
MRFRSEVRMAHHDSLPARPTADWISRYAAGLLDSTPGLQPLDAVRIAMDVSQGAVADSARMTLTPAAHPRATLR